MEYNLFKKAKGVNPSLFLTLSLDEEWVDISCVNDNIAFLFKDKIKVFNPEAREFVEEYPLNCNDACSFEYRNTRYFYLFENCTKISYYDTVIKSNMKLMDGSCSGEIKKRISKHKSVCGDMTIGKDGHFYFTIKELHKIFMFKRSNVNNIAGDGDPNYANGSDLLSCSFFYPEGMFYKNGSVFVADSGNACIREINNGKIKLFFGNPLEKIISPQKIYIGDNMIVFSSGINLYSKKNLIAENMVSSHSFCVGKSDLIYFIKHK